MKRKRAWELRLQKRLQRWLIPRTEAGTITLSVALEGTDEMIANLERIEAQLDRIAEKGARASAVLEKIGAQDESG